MSNKEFELNDEKLEEVSGGYYLEGEPLHKIGEKFETDFLIRYGASRRYGVITENSRYLDKWRGYEYKYVAYYYKDDSPAGFVDTTNDNSITNGLDIMSGYTIIN